MHPDARAVIDLLALAPHPEGGFYRETFRAPLALEGLATGPRCASTAIYFLLPAGTKSAFHRVRADEVWHHYDGDVVELHVFDPQGVYEVVRLGANLAAGERPQHVVPAGHWQAARPVGNRYGLCGCTVAPGFDFADFELPPAAELATSFPALRDVILSFASKTSSTSLPREKGPPA